MVSYAKVSGHQCIPEAGSNAASVGEVGVESAKVWGSHGKGANTRIMGEVDKEVTRKDANMDGEAKPISDNLR